jgi:hypothetical protein
MGEFVSYAVWPVESPDGRWLAVQRQYVEAAERHAKAEKWAIVPEVSPSGAGPGTRPAIPVVVGLHGGAVVAGFTPITVADDVGPERIWRAAEELVESAVRHT